MIRKRRNQKEIPTPKAELGITKLLNIQVNNCIQSCLLLQTPYFTIPSTVTVNVSSCLSGVDVIKLQFKNGGNCSSWKCSVNCINDAKEFWTEGILKIHISNICFQMIHRDRSICPKSYQIIIFKACEDF